MPAQRFVFVCCGLIIGVAATAHSAAVRSASVGTKPRDIVVNAPALKPFVDAANTRRVDVAGIGDSNQIAGPGSDYGWDHGYAKAWSDRFGWYGTGVFGMNAEGSWNGGAGYFDSVGYPYGAQKSGAPAELHKYKLTDAALPTDGNSFPPSYAYFAPGFQETAAHWTPSLWIVRKSPNWGQDLTWHYTYGTFTGGAGSFTPTASMSGQKVAFGKTVSTSTGAYGLSDGALRIPAAAYQDKPGQLYFGFSLPGQPSMQGPFFGLWQRVTNERASGVSYSTTLAQGGRALVIAATTLKNQPDDGLREYIRNLVRHQNAAPMLLVNVNHGGNDGGYTQQSVGPNPAPSYTPAGFSDNMEALIQRYRGIWTSLGYDPKNLVFQYGPYHPVKGAAVDGTTRTNIQRLADWENAIVKLSQIHPEYNLAVVRGTRLTTPETMSANQWYSSAIDHAHLSPEGYIGIAELGVRQILGYANIEAIANLSQITSLSFQFDGDISASLSPDDLLLREIATDTSIPAADLAVSWDPLTLTATWTFQGLPLGALPTGRYEARIASQLLAGSSTVAADSQDYVFSFTAQPVPEPATCAVVMLAGATLLARRRR